MGELARLQTTDPAAAASSGQGGPSSHGLTGLSVMAGACHAVQPAPAVLRACRPKRSRPPPQATRPPATAPEFETRP